MRVFAESNEGGQIVEISDNEDGQRVIEYVSTARAYGLREREIEEDIGGGEYERDGQRIAYDGLISWGCEAVFRCGDLYVGDPGIYV